MSLQGPAWVYPITGQPTNHGGWHGGAERMIPTSLIPDLQLLHLFGTDFHTVFAEDDAVSDYSIGDHSLLGRSLSNFGATPGTKSFTSGATAYYRSPLTGAQLMALSTDGSFTIFGVAKFDAGVHSALIGSWFGSTNDGIIMGRELTLVSRYNLLTSYADSGVADYTITINTDGDTGSVWELLVGVYNMTTMKNQLYRQKPGGSLQLSAEGTIPATFSPAQPLTIGSSFPSPSYTAGCKIVSVGAISSALSQSAVADLQGMHQEFLADYSVTI